MEEHESSARKNSYDPGWNDPPTLGYIPTAAPNKPKLSLNKRVAFPIQNAPTSTVTNVETSAAGLPLPFARVQQSPPILQNSPSPISASFPPTMSAPSTGFRRSIDHTELKLMELPKSDINPENALDYIKTTLEVIIQSLTINDGHKVEEIRKRLDNMTALWIDNKLDCKIKENILNTLRALENNQICLANDLHRSLVIEHAHVCSHWGSALRQLIMLKDQENQPIMQENSDDVESDVLYDMPNIASDIITQPVIEDEVEIEHLSIDGKSHGRVLHL